MLSLGDDNIGPVVHEDLGAWGGVYKGVSPHPVDEACVAKDEEFRNRDVRVEADVNGRHEVEWNRNEESRRVSGVRWRGGGGGGRAPG